MGEELAENIDSNASFEVEEINYTHVICGNPKMKPQKITIVLHNKTNIFQTPRQLHHAA